MTMTTTSHKRHDALTVATIYSLATINFLIVAWFWWHGSGAGLGRTTSGLLRGLGRLCGLYGALSIILEFVTVSRLPVLEQTLGRAKQLKLHKWFGYAAFIFILLHFSLITIGYAMINHTGVISQFVYLFFNFEDVYQAIIAVLLLFLLIGLSVSIVRRHLRYETWYFVHLLSYLVILLAFSHQMKVGPDFLSQPLFVAYWWFLYILTFALVVVWRFGRPLGLSFSRRLRVAKVQPETHNTYSVYIEGENLDKLKFKGGQFAIWWFMSKGRWWQGHPFSYSISPGGDQLRLTFKAIGDFTNDLPKLKPGAPVIMDGPYGVFTAAAIKRPRLLMIAGGIGITPLRSMLDEAAKAAENVILLYSVQTEADLALKQELEGQASKLGVSLIYVISDDPSYQGETGRIDKAKLQKLVPDVARRQVFLCGPPPMMAALTTTLQQLDVPKQLIETEDFRF
ncbi:MAG TPA: ferric reductase-like transmembrane domain-containing protein [Candidatus Nanoarchaeia archaeon]|nr:ferric reductase-like transmembrane domain-containing protein [Candidatus Nanoarchaeia archaeon]